MNNVMNNVHWIHWGFCSMHHNTNQGLVDKLGAEQVWGSCQRSDELPFRDTLADSCS